VGQCWQPCLRRGRVESAMTGVGSVGVMPEQSGTVGHTGGRSATTAGWRIVCSKWRYLSNWNNTTDRSTLVPVVDRPIAGPQGSGGLGSGKTRDLGAMPGIGPEQDRRPED
jgi:hypothetical protein